MVSGVIQTIGIKRKDKKRARKLQFWDWLCDWKLFDALISFAEENPKSFKDWVKKKEKENE